MAPFQKSFFFCLVGLLEAVIQKRDRCYLPLGLLQFPTPMGPQVHQSDLRLYKNLRLTHHQWGG